MPYRCWCGDNDHYDTYGAGLCNFDCSGASDATCGGDYAFSLYVIYGDGGVDGVDFSDDHNDDDGEEVDVAGVPTPSSTSSPSPLSASDDDLGDDAGR